MYYRIFRPRILLLNAYWQLLGMITTVVVIWTLTMGAGDALGWGVLLLCGLAFLCWPVRVLVITPYDLRMRKETISARSKSPSLARIDWAQVREVFVARHGDAATLVVGHNAAPTTTSFSVPAEGFGLEATRVELPSGYDHGRLVDTIRQIAALVPVCETTAADLLLRTRERYAVQPSQPLTRLMGFVSGCAVAAALMVISHYNVPGGIVLFILASPVAIQSAPLLTIGPDGLRMSRWSARVTGWTAVASVRVSAVDERVEIRVTTLSGRAMQRRVPRERIDLATVDAMLRAYAPPGALTQP